MNYYKLGDTIRACFGTADDTGAAADADAPPTAVALEQGTPLAYAPVVTNEAVGLYEVACVASTANGFEAGKEYTVYVVATVGGITGRGGLMSFSITATNVDDVPTVGEINTELVSEHGDGYWNASEVPSAALVAATVWASIIESGYDAAEILRLLSAIAVGDATGMEGPDVEYFGLDGVTTRVTGTITDETRDATIVDLED